MPGALFAWPLVSLSFIEVLQGETVLSGERALMTARTLRVTGLVTGTGGLLEHLGVVKRSGTPIPWSDVVRIEAKRIVVRDRRQ